MSDDTEIGVVPTSSVSISAKPVYIEQWLSANFSMYSSPEELCKNLYGYILKHSKENFGEICVISAGRQSESVYFSEACISLHSFHMEAWNQSDWGFRINGSDFHKQYFAEHSSEFLTLDQNLLCARLENINTKYAKKFIEKYNPVGSRWDVEIF